MTLHHGGFPIRKSADITLICSSPQLIAACRVLLRLLMPRHSPCALIRLNFPKQPVKVVCRSFRSMLFSELLEFHKQILFGIHIAVKGLSFRYIESFPPCGEIVILITLLWKDQIFSINANLVNFVL